MHWSGWCAGKPEKPDTKTNEFFLTDGCFLTVQNITLSYIWAKFLGEKTSIPGLSYTFYLNKNFKALLGMDYKTSAGAPLYRIGISYFPNK